MGESMQHMTIVEARREDATLIGCVVVEAIGAELAAEFAGNRRVNAVVDLFAALAAREDSQYSYRNALKAVAYDGAPMGFIVGYDGARLHELRRAFFEEVKRHLGYDMDGAMPDETDPAEFYLDSLAVFPEYRGRGVASALINAIAERAGKPLGLLCDKSNVRARRLYERLGFSRVGDRLFAGEVMDHMIKMV
ncbi:MAG: GNAT family N-acetyltransferase [Bacteroides sp.]|nr:GNAT family N-acetyltransferase [Bacteroides sp.]MCM1379620.1 GNAT family N-acetyltransferase [Bacteroides sp.]MCM1445998.1 GNAT family N-acetyltransferase [Prevotella sp.]